jgi:hypothetical protein
LYTSNSNGKVIPQNTPYAVTATIPFSTFPNFLCIGF